MSTEHGTRSPEHKTPLVASRLADEISVGAMTQITTDWKAGVPAAIDNMPTRTWTDAEGRVHVDRYTAAPVPQAGKLKRLREGKE